jgi:hypothetical protein
VAVAAGDGDGDGGNSGSGNTRLKCRDQEGAVLCLSPELSAVGEEAVGLMGPMGALKFQEKKLMASDTPLTLIIDSSGGEHIMAEVESCGVNIWNLLVVEKMVAGWVCLQKNLQNFPLAKFSSHLQCVNLHTLGHRLADLG